MDSTIIFQDVEKIRRAVPLVHNITNYVVMNNTANALLALGASPVMAHAAEEVADMVKIASALVINIGTLSPAWVESMNIAAQSAADKGIPWVLDPVGAGATPYRTVTAKQLNADHRPSIIRGNASEIMALVDSGATAKGVDSQHAAEAALESAKILAHENKAVVVISGETDYITDGQRVITVKNGSPLMPRVTGMGCIATALVGAFAAINPDRFQAAAHAMAVMGIAGEIATEKAAGPGTLQLHFMDTLYGLTAGQIRERFRE